MRKKFHLLYLVIVVGLTATIAADTFLCGDPNADGSVDISDAVYLISYIFSGGAAPQPILAGDANHDGSVDISDVVYLIAYIFSGGPQPYCPPTDIDGNVYQTVTIGTQVWMAENLKVTHYRNGDAIPNVTDGTTWAGLTTGAYCDYNNDVGNADAYGRLYNWYAVGDSRNIAPEGWHIATDAEWQTLVEYLGGLAVAGGKMKEVGLSHWNSPNSGATNESGFTARAGGYRRQDGTFTAMGIFAYLWSSTQNGSDNAWFRAMYYLDGQIHSYYFHNCSGMSVRCVKDTDATTVTDVDGNVYQTVTIGTQVWMAENLKVTHYRNGDAIPNVTNGTTWAGLTTGAHCEYNNDVSNVDAYGRIYNWYALSDSRNIAPEGWHVPSDAEWKQLEMYLGLTQAEADATEWRGTDEGGKLKEAGTTHWLSPNTGATNESGFTALPGGYRIYSGPFGSMSNYAFFWSSTVNYSNDAWHRRLHYSYSAIYRNGLSKAFGFSIRCVKDAEEITVTDIDGNVYQTVTIGTQVWMAENLKVTHYRNGDAIPNVTDNATWTGLTTGAYCEYNNDVNNVAAYGRLYNWYAVGDSRNIAPAGWHVASDAEWQTLVDHLGGSAVAGGKLKEAGTSHWSPPNTGATNETGFTALPGGYRNGDGPFFHMGNVGFWWTATEDGAIKAWRWRTEYLNGDAERNSNYKIVGWSVRCVKD